MAEPYIDPLRQPIPLQGGLQALQAAASSTPAYPSATEDSDEPEPAEEAAEPSEEAEAQMPHILDIAQMANVVDLLDENQLRDLGRRVKEEYDVDRSTMDEWLTFADKMLDLVTQTTQRKTFPFDQAANTRLPLITNAILSSHAEEMPEVIRDDQVLKAKIFGVETPEKVQRAERVEKRLNWWLFYGIPDWEEGHDRTVLFKNMLGVVHKKTYWCKESERFECEVLPAGVVVNDNTTTLAKAPRITHEFELPWWDVEQRFRSGAWKRIELRNHTIPEGSPEADKVQKFLEQIRREDIDDDGYPEPYVVTVHADTMQIVSVVPNFTPETIWFNTPLDQLPEGEQPKVVGVDADRGRIRYVKYEMLPALDGGYWSWGFMRLLGPLTDNCNTLINQLLDAGTLANTQGGFIADSIRFSREDGGKLEFQPGEWKRIKNIGGRIADNVFPLPVAQPSPVLFQLLGLLMETVREHSNTTKLMQGEQPQGNMPAASVLALLEQGKKSFGQVFKRHRRALAKEGLALFDLAFLYESQQDYQEFFDQPVDPREDFKRAGIDVVPVAQPEFSTRVTRLAEAEALMKVLGDPRVNGSAILFQYISAVLNDSQKAAQMVPQEPNKTPEQVVQALEQQKQEMLAELEVQAKKTNVEQAAVDLETSKQKFAEAKWKAENPRPAGGD